MMRPILIGALATIAFAATMTIQLVRPMLSSAQLAHIAPGTEVLWSHVGLPAFAAM